MFRDKLLWSAVNAGVLPRAKESWRQYQEFLPAGSAKPEHVATPAYVALITSVGSSLPSASPTSPPTVEMVTLSCFEDADGALQNMKTRARMQFYIFLIMTVVFFLLFLLFGLVFVYQVMYQGLGTATSLTGAISALSGVLITLPASLLTTSSNVLTETDLLVSKYRPNINLCRSGKELKNDAVADAVIRCIRAEVTAMLDEFRDSLRKKSATT